jgi:hypothetical protein
VTLNVPNDFIPQTQQTISSTQVDQNFTAIEVWGNALENQLLNTGSADTYTTQKTFTQHPLSTSVAALPQNGLATRAVLDIFHPIGSITWLPVPKLPSVGFGIEYKWPNGQQVDYATYIALYNYLTQSLSPACAGVAIVGGSSPQKFTMPDITGTIPQIANTLGGLGSSRVNGGRADMANLGTPCGLVGSQGFLIAFNDMPVGTMVRPYGGNTTLTGFSGTGGVQLNEILNQNTLNFTPQATVLYPAMRVL